ncbi:hypothetical protein [Streptomyces sp. bgisy060]|uniref:hypothetical protein n=1 Tax=Streptomyces sp. bgisy060 TaxID=3413775 RepID=UPI003EB8BE3F
MSLNRENVTWQAPDGTWSIGFWAHDETGDPDDEDFDPEWDVEYLDYFGWVSTGHPTWEAAMDAYEKDHPNPGGTTIYRGGSEDAESIAEFERLAAEYTAREAEGTVLHNADEAPSDAVLAFTDADLRP